MAHKVLPPICLNEEAAENSGIVLPSFTLAPFAGRTPLDEVSTDLVLMTKLYRHDIPAALHVSEPSAAELLKSSIGEEFSGKRGQVSLLQSTLPNSQGEPGRYFLLYGLGPEQHYGGRTTCALFETFFKQALELGVAHVTVPFIPNPMTKNSMTHRATAFKLKHVLRQVLRAWQGPVPLREVTLYCTPAAVRHIKAGLQIELPEGGCPCESKRK